MIPLIDQSVRYKHITEMYIKAIKENNTPVIEIDTTKLYDVNIGSYIEEDNTIFISLNSEATDRLSITKDYISVSLSFNKVQVYMFIPLVWVNEVGIIETDEFIRFINGNDDQYDDGIILNLPDNEDD